MFDKSMQLQILIPLGGKGLRFQEKGYDKFKPTIVAKNRPMILWAIDSARRLHESSRLVLSILGDKQAGEVKKILEDEDIDFESAVFHEETKGAIQSCLKAWGLINKDAPLLIVDCDIAFESPKLKDLLSKEVIDCDAFLTTFPSTDSSFSFAETDGQFVKSTVEKKVISRNAIIGAYFFKRAELFFESAQKIIAKGLGNEREFYVSFVFNQMIQDGRIVKWGSGSFTSFGTPEELEKFNLNAKP